jgi:putative membrane protein
MTSALFSALHIFTLALGLPGLFLRGRWLKANDLPRAFMADTAWGIAALLWLGTGLMRAFGGLEKGSAYYLHSNTFWVKMALFGVITLLEIYPMVTLIRWRMAAARKQPIDTGKLPLLVRLNSGELAVLLLMPFVASAMARGIGY